MSAAGDTVVSDAGAGPANAGAAGGLLLVLEPPGMESQAGGVLLAEGGRLAGRLGVPVRAVTWQDSAPGEAVDVSDVADAIAARARAIGPNAVLLADTDTARALAPLLAYRLGSGAVLGCSDVLIDQESGGSGPGGDGSAGDTRGLRFVKPVYGGWLEQEVYAAAGDGPPVVTLDLSGIEGAASADGQAPACEALSVAAAPEGDAPVRRLELIPPDARSVDLVHARRIVAAGMGAADEDLLATVHELAELLDGSVGATRPVVDEGRLPKERLIGQTGRTVTPELYVALGISGSPHHVAGVRKADKILSVNRDPRAPIFQFSDVGYVADLQVVLPALVARIREWRDAGE